MSKKIPKSLLSTATSKSTSRSTTRVKKQPEPEIVSEDFSEERRKLKEKSWYVFVTAYLEFTKKGCECLLKLKKLSTKDKYVVIGIIYNLKHGLEIILKAVSRSINKNLDSSDTHHDIKKLFHFVMKAKSQAKKVGKIKDEIMNLKSLIDKYNELVFLKNYLKNNFVIDDYKNLFFKYPENEMEVIIDYSGLLSYISLSDVENTEKDVKMIIKTVEKIKKIEI